MFTTTDKCEYYKQFIETAHLRLHKIDHKTTPELTFVFETSALSFLSSRINYGKINYEHIGNINAWLILQFWNHLRALLVRQRFQAIYFYQALVKQTDY